MDQTITADVREFGACGNGLSDDAPAFCRALESGARRVMIPDGLYLIGSPLKIASDTHIAASDAAVLLLGDGACKTKDDFFLSNSDPEHGNRYITVEGGTWNANNPGNRRVPGIFCEGAYTGVMFDFRNVENLTLKNLKLCDPESYYVRLGEVRGFHIASIRFDSVHLRPNQDGIHLGGFCFDGVIEDIAAGVWGSANDDMVAFNADDEVERIVNQGMKRGPISRVRVSGVRAADCHTFVRLLSVDAEISDIAVGNISGGCRAFAVNMDAARYCRTPLFKDGDRPGGVGRIRNVTIDDMRVHKTADNGRALIIAETAAQNLVISHFTRTRSAEPPNGTPTFSLGKVRQTTLCIDGERVVCPAGGVFESDKDVYGEILIDTVPENG